MQGRRRRQPPPSQPGGQREGTGEPGGCHAGAGGALGASWGCPTSTTRHPKREEVVLEGGKADANRSEAEEAAGDGVQRVGRDALQPWLGGHRVQTLSEDTHPPTGNCKLLIQRTVER